MIRTLSYPEAVKNYQFPNLEVNLFSSCDWLTVLYKTYRLKLFVKFIEKNDKISSYIVYSVVKNFLESKLCICSYCDYFDCHVENLEDWQLLFQSLREEYPEYRIAIRNLRDEVIKKLSDLKVLSKERYHILDIRTNLDEIWKRTHDSFKSAVKQGQNSGITVKRCEKRDLKKFYELHLRLRKNKYRLFPQPYRFFDTIWDQFMNKDKGVLLGAYDLQGHFIAGTIYLMAGNSLYYKFNTSDMKALKYRPNNVLFWEGIKYAKYRNLDYIDLGSSGYQQNGLILFKDHTGAEISDITHLGYNPKHYKFSRKIILNLLTRFFTSPVVPDQLVEIFSRIIYPYLA